MTSPHMVWMSWLLPKNITRHHFRVHFDHRQSYKKFKILTQNHSLTHLEKIQDGGHHNLTSPYMVWMSCLLPKNITRHHFQVHFDHRKSYKKFKILTQNHRLTPLGKNARWQLPKFNISIYGQNHFDFTLKHTKHYFLTQIP